MESLLAAILINGLLLGILYAIIALGYTMVYGILQLINFAHSEVFVTGAIIAYETFRILSPAPDAPPGSGLNPYIVFVIALVVAMLVCGLLNILIERLAYRPLRNAPKLVPLISAIGVSFILQDLLRLFEGVQGRFDLAVNVPAAFNANVVTILDNNIQIKDVLLVVVAAVMLFGLNRLVNHSKTGRAIRAVAQDRVTAGLMGIDSNRMIALTFMIGGALGGLGGVLFAMKFPNINAYSGTIPGTKAFSAAVLGGIGSIPGAVLGGLVLGVVENFLGVLSSFALIFPKLAFLAAIKSEYKDVGAFIALIVILIFKPSGLLGRNTTEKV
ncbi:branched-chain amino acid ABC transporter permease [Deinococcus ruber]|uniref:Branched-chain amino acid ABC transporter permease n=1 Tax=Deinococcus ruber TaxID=1848197 RepID=A0A918F3W0_9DEIO|nr:branched-chain amino acid ABC transporter permease [Deinococcus ruber]GGQ99033.1 branched-chain amino acid ABC transporter permease [Deinococcus ruber]